MCPPVEQGLLLLLMMMMIMMMRDLTTAVLLCVVGSITHYCDLYRLSLQSD